MRAEQVGVVANPKVSESYLERLLAALDKHGLDVNPICEAEERRVADTEPDLVFVLGGDGTMLRASRMYP